MPVNEAFVTTSQRAATSFGLTGTTFTSVPRLKHLWAMSLTTNPAIPNTGNSLGTMSQYYHVMAAEKPKISFETEMLNEYNKKRQVYKRVMYEPVTIRFYDTVDNTALNIWKAYAQYYFNDFSPAKVAGDWVYDQTYSQFNQGSQNQDWGFNINNKASATLAQFFYGINLFDLYGGNMQQTILINPKITMFSPDTLDYTVAGECQQITMSIAYEGVKYMPLQPITSSLIDEFNLDISDYTSYIPGYGSLPIEERVGASDQNETFSLSNITSDIDQLISNAENAAFATLQPLQNLSNLIASPLNDINSVVNSIGFAENSITGSALDSFGYFAFGGLSNSVQSLVDGTVGLFGNLLNVPNLATQFGGMVDLSFSGTTSQAVQQSAQVYQAQDIPIYPAPTPNSTPTPPTSTPVTIYNAADQPVFSVNTPNINVVNPSAPPVTIYAPSDTAIPPELAVSPTESQTPTSFLSPNTYISNNLINTNLSLASQQGAAISQQATQGPKLTQGQAPIQYAPPSIPEGNFNCQLGKIPGTSGKSPYARAVAGILAAAGQAGAFSNGALNGINNLKGAQLNPIVVQAINAARSPTSQVGFRIAAIGSPFANFTATYAGPTGNSQNQVFNQQGQPIGGQNPYGPTGQPNVLAAQRYSIAGALINAEITNTENDVTLG